MDNKLQHPEISEVMLDDEPTVEAGWENTKAHAKSERSRIAIWVKRLLAVCRRWRKT